VAGWTDCPLLASRQPVTPSARPPLSVDATEQRDSRSRAFPARREVDANRSERTFLLTSPSSRVKAATQMPSPSTRRMWKCGGEPETCTFRRRPLSMDGCVCSPNPGGFGARGEVFTPARVASCARC